MPTPADRAIARDVLDERDAQRLKWGDESMPDGTGDRSLRERAEHAQHATDAAMKADRCTWRLVLEEEVFEALAETDPALLRAELAQVAAVAQSWMLDLDRRTGALAASRPQISPAHLRVAFLLAESEGATDTRLLGLYQRKVARSGSLAWPLISESGLRSRRAELVDWGLAEWTGEYGRTAANRPSKVWALTRIPARYGSPLEVPEVDATALAEYRALRDESAGDLVVRAGLEKLLRDLQVTA